MIHMITVLMSVAALVIVLGLIGTMLGQNWRKIAEAIAMSATSQSLVRESILAQSATRPPDNAGFVPVLVAKHFDNAPQRRHRSSLYGNCSTQAPFRFIWQTANMAEAREAL